MGMRAMASDGCEEQRLREDCLRQRNWTRWGPYLAERQWGTVREDYSVEGDSWSYFPHDHARSRAYRWGEDGLLGWCDRECRLCFAPALWNGRDPILKERLFGLDNHEGNHGEDVKELYYYLDATPTYAYARAQYKYPQAAFPYAELVAENRRRGPTEPEYELADTGVFAEDRYFDLVAEFAKASPDDLLIRFTVANRGPEAAVFHLLATLWFRNTWIWGCRHEGCTLKPRLEQASPLAIRCEHETLGGFYLAADLAPDGTSPVWLFTENESNSERLWGQRGYTRHVKDAFHRFVVQGDASAVSAAGHGTKAAAWYSLVVPAGDTQELRLRLFAGADVGSEPFGRSFAKVFTQRRDEADAFYAGVIPAAASAEARGVARQAYAGLLWSRQFYHLSAIDWLEGDADVAPPLEERRRQARNQEWPHLFNRDLLSVPDKWEYPWYASWDLAFHMIPMARIDAEFAKRQLLLLLREWYMHPNGQLPAYEWAFSDVNPPVHAWACWRVYKMTAPRGRRDRDFLQKAFHKLVLNFTWWVNRKDPEGHNLFGGGFLGLDNVGVFDRSKPLPTGGRLAQADGTAWMAFFCLTMLAIAIELAEEDPAYADMASKFFEHFVQIADAMNHFAGRGLWDEGDGFYYDDLLTDHSATPVRVRSLVGLVPLMAVEVLHADDLARLPEFSKRMEWFLQHRRDLAGQVSWMRACSDDSRHMLLAIPSRERLLRLLRYLFDPSEFLSPYGIRSLSRYHLERPYVLAPGYESYAVRYCPGDSESNLFGGNSNWRGPIWLPMNFLLIEALEKYHHFFGDSLRCEYPTGSGRERTLAEVAADLSERLVSLFLPGAEGRRPCHGADERYAADPHFRDLLLFHEFFHGESGQGLGASHQTGWTALVAKLIEDQSAAACRQPSSDSVRTVNRICDRVPLATTRSSTRQTPGDAS
jgi:hypothetical protein